ncbi:hypothetical protein BJ944DRAFT_273394 [Cunninghamella echinulata]|nr:hypothetical protein BJ944DRAFT_273394 [Cunninghamella echinulata]
MSSTTTSTTMNNTSPLEMNELTVNDIELLTLLTQQPSLDNIDEQQNTTSNTLLDISTPTVALLDWEDWQDVTTTTKKRKYDSSNSSLCSNSSSSDDDDDEDEVNEEEFDFLNQFDFVDVDFNNTNNNNNNNDTIKDDLPPCYKKQKFIREDDDISSLLQNQANSKKNDLDYRWVLDLA